MQEQSQSFKQFFRTMNIIHLAMVSGLIVFAFVLIAAKFSGAAEAVISMDLHSVLLVIAVIFAASGVSASLVVTRSRLQKIMEIEGLDNKLNAYRTLLIIKFALLEGPALFILVAYFLADSYILLVLALLLIFLLMMSRPSNTKAFQDLGLDPEGRDRTGD